MRFLSRSLLKTLQWQLGARRLSCSSKLSVRNYERGTNFDILGAWDNRLEMPVLIEESIKEGKPIPKVSIEHIGYASLIGRRKENEDRIKISELTPGLLFCGIYDGHSGNIAADYACDYLEDHIRFWLSKEHDIQKVLTNSFIDLNNVFTRHLYFLNASKGIDEMSGGTTATVCIVRNSVEMVIAHVGDSRAVLCRKGQARRLTIDHEPELEEESARIRESGGVIAYNSLGSPSVNSRLAMTRSIGDVELKSYGVIAKPYTRSVAIKHGLDAFLILMTDGITYAMNDQELVDIVSTCATPQEAARIVTEQALHFGSEDNSSCIVIPFGSWGKYAKTTHSVQYSFGRSILGRRYN